jgi:hypothetical protein
MFSFLPEIEKNVMRDPHAYYVDNNIQLDEFIGRMHEILVGDCAAIVADGEVIFSKYHPRTIYQKIHDKFVFREIMMHPMSLFGDLIRENKDFSVNIYMYDDTPWFVCISHNTTLKLMYIEYFMSKKYMDVYT